MDRPTTIFPGSRDQWTERFFPESASSSTSKPGISRPSNKGNNQESRFHRIHLPVNHTGSYGDRPVPVTDGSPWRYYRNACGLDLGGSVAVVCKTPATEKLFAMHSFSGTSRDEKLHMLRQLKHGNLLSPEEIFCFEESIYVISEYTAISLKGAALVRPDEIQLAAIVHQVSPYLLASRTYSLTRDLDIGCHIIPYVAKSNPWFHYLFKRSLDH